MKLLCFQAKQRRDEGDDERRRVFKHTLKHVKWLANKGELKNVVLHSFTDLGGENASPELAATGFQVASPRSATSVSGS